MKFVLIVGSGAVGKMSVGQVLSRKTGLRLMHNHMMIEPVIEIFDYLKSDLVADLRKRIFEEFAKEDMYGLIFTYMWAFDMQKDWDYVENVVNIFKKANADIYCVELVADQNIRLERNVTENRLKNKPSKRDLDFSRDLLLSGDEHRLESYDGELPFENYIKIDNTNLKPEEVANIVIEKFGL